VNEIVVLPVNDLEHAACLARARMDELERQTSTHRPSARNFVSQLRGAIGEIGSVRWLEANGLHPDAGFESDRPGDTDITVNGVRLEVMTGQVAHRAAFGFCVPPGKLAAARRRGAWGYVFAGVGPSARPTRVLIQAVTPARCVDLDPAREVGVMLNFVIRPEALSPPERLIAMLLRA